MKKQKAIQEFTTLLDELRVLKWSDYELWLPRAKSTIGHLFGEDSTEFQYINDIARGGDAFDGSHQEYLQQQKGELSDLQDTLPTFLQTLKLKGAYRHPKRNFISSLSQEWVLFIVSAILGIIGWLLVELYNANKEINRLTPKEVSPPKPKDTARKPR